MGALARLGRVTELRPRVHAVRTRLDALPPAAAVDALEALLTSPTRRAVDEDLLLACGLALVDADVEPLRRVAEERAPRTALFLADGAAHRALPRHGRLPDVGLFEERPCTLPRFVTYREPVYVKVYTGDAFPYRNWEWQAVGYEIRRVRLPPHGRLYDERRRDFLTRAVHHPSAAFLGRFLGSPDATPAHALAIAVRRPSTAAIARVLVDHAPSIARPEVRLALALNPFTPTRLALLLVPSLRASLREIAGANVHPLVRAFARQLWL